MVELIYEDESRRLAIRRRDAVSPSMTELAAATVWGSGGTRYVVSDIASKLQALADAEFITLERDENVIGLYVLRKKRVRIGSSMVNACYRTLLTLKPEYRGRGYGALLAEQTRRHVIPELGEPGLLYGYVEEENSGSMRTLRRAGYESVASFRSSILSRWRPRLDSRCRLLETSERDSIEALLWELYDDHALLDFDQSLDPAGYWVMETTGGLVAGVQVERCHWRVLKLSGISGAFLVHAASRIPVLRGLFNARECRFLKLGNLFARPGYESHLFTLMESVLAAHQVNAALVFHDPRSGVFRRIRESGRFGILDSGIDAKVHIMAETAGFTRRQDQALRDEPVIISPMDIG